MIKKNAFTLVELLVVMVIVGVLASIGVATMNQQIIDTRNMRTVFIARQYHEGIKRMFATEGVEAFNAAFPVSTNLYNTACLGTETCLWDNNPTVANPDVNALLDKHVVLDNVMEKHLQAENPYSGMALVRPPSNLLEDQIWIIYLLEGEADCLLRPMLMICGTESATINDSPCSLDPPYTVSYDIPWSRKNRGGEGNTDCRVPLILSD